ncbi:hypothetical protein BT96DRAFT_928580 [Gymnopus androsaceus JB14]|uniref:Uncharacterized protein n=1 Tax=Gymnopus androsaceus JB14 TaxID=1447944 RepID=A0A6A4GKM1_9AGAR|nr:hypothetical protein BT96DRAFT_928580 [Gymnopus androsaceus JB14]
MDDYNLVPYMPGATPGEQFSEIKKLLRPIPSPSSWSPDCKIPLSSLLCVKEELTELQRLISLDPASNWIMQNYQREANAQSNTAMILTKPISGPPNRLYLPPSRPPPSTSLEVAPPTLQRKAHAPSKKPTQNKFNTAAHCKLEDDTSTEYDSASEAPSYSHQSSFSSTTSSGSSMSIETRRITPRTLPSSSFNGLERYQGICGSDNTTLINRFRKILADFPHKNIHNPDLMRNFKSTVNEDGIYEHLKMVALDYEKIFYFPGCTHKTVTGAQHLLAFRPLAQAIPNFTHRICSRFVPFYGATRELFLKRKNGLVYAGRYKMHSLLHLALQGLDLPLYVSAENISFIATPPIQPRGFLFHDQLCNMYKSGTLRVECVALQMVDYDGNIYRALKSVQMEKVSRSQRK